MAVTEMLTDLKQHLEHGGELLASHLGPLLEWASKADQDPFVQMAVATTLGETGKQIVVDLVGRLQALEQEAEAAKQQAAAEAAAAATAAATAPPADPAADPSAESAG